MVEEIHTSAGKMFSSETQDGEQPMIHCPVCGYNYVHLNGHELNTGVRGDVLVVRFWGECGHSWGLVFGEHKGTMDYDIVEEQSNG